MVQILLSIYTLTIPTIRTFITHTRTLLRDWDVRTRVPIPLLGRIPHLTRRSLPHYPRFLTICLSHPKSNPYPRLRSRMGSHRQGILLRHPLPSSRAAIMPPMVIRRFPVTIPQRTALIMLCGQGHPGPNSCRPYSQRVPGTHLSMDLFPELTLDNDIIQCSRWKSEEWRVELFFFHFRITEDPRIFRIFQGK